MMADVLPVGGKESDRLTPGTRLGRYELLVPVARGGMARVWAARQHGQRGFTKIVAVKTILPHLRKELQFERMFQNEARVASFVQHPNVCQIVELGEDAEILFMAMEWINGDSLARALKASGRVVPMDARIIARIIADACAGLHAAHVQTDELGRPLNIVHRDVSPHNIMFTADGNVKVCDFGVAKALNQLQDATLAGQVKGKVSYMPPEQFMGSPLDARADIFAMGVVMYEATTGRQPFEGENDLIIMQRLARGDYAHPSLIVHGYPRELEQIIVRAMQPEPMHRFQNAEHMRIALEEWLARSGPIVTQTNVAQAVRERIGGLMEARRQQILAASQGQDPNQSLQDAGIAGHTPSNLQANAPQASGLGGSPKSGVMPRGAPGAPAAPAFRSSPPPLPPHGLKSTMQLPPGLMPPITFPSAPAAAPFANAGPPPIPPQNFLPQNTVPPNSSNQGSAVSTPWWESARDPLSPAQSVPPASLPQPTHFTVPPASGFDSPFVPAPQSSMAVPKRSSGASYYAFAIGLGVVIAGIIGAGGYVAWARSQRRVEPVVIVSASSSASAGSSGGPGKSAPGVAISSLPVAPPAPVPSATAASTPADTAPAPTDLPADPTTSNTPSTGAPGATGATSTSTATPHATATAMSTSGASNSDPPVQTGSGSGNSKPASTQNAASTATATPTASSTKPVKPSALPDNPY